MELVDGETTPDPDEVVDLIPSLTTRAEINAFEQSNIFEAVVWAQKSRKLRRDLIQVNSLRLVHRRMFDKTWRWAGQFRVTAKNIGVEPYQIANQLGQLVGNANYWLETNAFPFEEIAVRVHHKLVWIHPFPNGNGRHARLIADLLMHYEKRPSLTWGGASIDVEGVTRRQYLLALREADKGNFEPLIEFAKQR